ncbi:MAG: DNA polymerase III subunit gamma/tau C-terminal domain-containing protein, partial [Gammaproteobacteria bacterium]
LKRLPAEMIAEHLAKLLDAEKIQAEPAALRQLALAADGSMRDALSLLDQAIAFGEGAVREPEVLDMLGGISREHVHALLNTLAAGDGSHLLSEVAKLAEQAPDYSAVLADLITLLQQIALIQQVPELSDERVDEPELIRQLATTLSPEDVQLYYQIALMGRRDLPLSPDPRGGFEMVLLRMLAFRPDAAAESTGGSRPGGAARPAPSAGNPSAPPAKPASAPKASYAEPAPAAPRVSEPPPAERTPPRPAPARAADPNAPWTEVVPALGLTGMSLQLANHCMPAGRDGKAFKLKLSREHESLLGPRSVERLEQALCDYYQDALKLSVEVVDELTETPAAVAQRNEITIGR